MSQLTCPYCFDRFDPKTIEFRCINTNCSKEVDEKLVRFGLKERMAERNKVVLPKKKLLSALSQKTPQKATCGCGTETNKKICPKCHNQLPHQFGENKNLVIALIGAPNAGKTQYIALLIRELMGRIGRNFDAFLGSLDEGTRTKYIKKYKTPIDEKRVVDKTESAIDEEDVRFPLAYELSFNRKTAFGRSSAFSVSLSFFDTAGEDLKHEDTMSQMTRYIANADGLIFLFDPLQLPTVQDLIGSKKRVPDSSQDQVLIRATQLIEKMASSSKDRKKVLKRGKITIPVAITFSKIDVLRDHIDSRLLRASEHLGYFDLRDATTVNDLFHAYMEEWGGSEGRNMVAYVKQKYDNYSFFGASALGDEPVGIKLPRGANPFRIEDPLLWILYQHKIIKAKRN